MPDPIRLLVSDIDGTLVRNDKTLSEGVVAAARRVRKAGIMMSLISARPPCGMLWIAETLGLDGPIGAFNGGTLVMPGGLVLSADHLDPAAAARALALLDQPGVTPWLFTNGKWYARDRTNSHLPRERRAANLEPIFDTDFATLLDRVDKLVGVSEDHALLAMIEGETRAVLGDGANVARSQPYYLDVTAPRANKGDGVTALAAAYGVPLSAVAVLGDQHNDLPMFARAALSVAMGQAPEAVRAAATHVARSNEEDGVADAIARFILPAFTE
ncbi:HAD family phosphatase [Sphingomonas sp. JC676]|uniref:Cof-type HAD-IIB family hydrolase n=1 Tax=Sphingomonas sp. JC676 TaxID=2768065 RepID=UPI001657825C|nr:Cof-type HAD-IIB family hydrolase [Sphingomonas sp. JC676]MBC9032174.1 HAD family phosphatase [Sphingomonas sp. JC676]